MLDQMAEHFPISSFDILIGLSVALAVLILLATFFIISARNPIEKLKKDLSETNKEFAKMKQSISDGVEKKLFTLDKKLVFVVEELNKLKKEISFAVIDTSAKKKEMSTHESVEKSNNDKPFGLENDLAKMNKYMSTTVALLIDIREKLTKEKIGSRQVSPREKSALTG